MRKKSLVINQKDNVAVVLEACDKGDTILTSEGELVLLEKVQMGHKVLLHNLKAKNTVYKYGEDIGYVLQDTEKGSWIHNHNMGCDRGK